MSAPIGVAVTSPDDCLQLKVQKVIVSQPSVVISRISCIFRDLFQIRTIALVGNINIFAIGFEELFGLFNFSFGHGSPFEESL